MTNRAQWGRGIGHPPSGFITLLIDGIRVMLLRVIVAVTTGGLNVISTITSTVTAGSADADLTEMFTMTPDLVVTP
jgi:hypothetical protein